MDVDLVQKMFLSKRINSNVPYASNEKHDESDYTMSAHSIKRHCTALRIRREARFSCPTWLEKLVEA